MGVRLSARVTPEMAEQLEELAKADGLPSSELVRRAVDEYLRTVRFPGIAFITGGSGQRKAKLLGGPDIWAVVFTAQNHDMDVMRTAEYLNIRVEAVKLALAYYAAYPDEIDARLRRIEETDEDPTLLHPSIRIITVSDLEHASTA